MTDMQLFDNGEFELRLTPNGDSFRVAAPSLARDLGFKDAHDLVRNLPEAEKGAELVRTPGGDQRVWYVTEAGFYRAIGQRQVARIKDDEIRKQVARFQDWVYGEVLPAIRKTGGYSITLPTVAALPEAEPFEPVTYSLADTVVLMRQKFGVKVPVVELTRILRAGGVLCQNGKPKVDYEALFWHTGSAYEVFGHRIEALYRLYESTKLRLEMAAQAKLRMDPPGWPELPFASES